MSVFIEHLKSEHRLFERGLALLKKLRHSSAPENARFEDIQTLLDCMGLLVGRVHHYKEEELLFPLLHETGRLSEGGPMCTLFQGLSLENDFSGRITQRRKNSYTSHELNEKMKKALNAGSPLRIPIEEHLLGHECLWQAKQYKNIDSSFNKIIDDYYDLLRLHIRKEDECLFRVAEYSLSEAQEVELLREAQTIDAQIGIDIIEKSKNKILELEKKYEKDIA